MKPFRLRLPPLAIALATLQAGCANVVSDRAICDGTDASRAAHAGALANDGGAESIRTGALLIRQIDAACQKSP